MKQAMYGDVTVTEKVQEKIVKIVIRSSYL